MSDFTGFILIGGKSSRMGEDKFALQFDGKSFLENAVGSLKETCENRVKLVLNQTQTIETELPVVRDIYENRGALGAIHAALKHCDTKFAVVLAVDLPFITNEIIKKLAQFTLSSNKFLANVPRQTDGRIQPLCAVYRAKYCLPTLETLMNENETASPRDFLELVNTRYISQQNLAADTETDIFFNVNTPEDLGAIV
ncbi:MAG TPA: molybdenum cofactor guanylyltransferase [Pyrinomonadaceae bacterium]|nr:molybdenum cofactor guanylyltransferase [Pyrinomonadaceae bacterium]